MLCIFATLSCGWGTRLCKINTALAEVIFGFVQKSWHNKHLLRGALQTSQWTTHPGTLDRLTWKTLRTGPCTDTHILGGQPEHYRL